MTTNNTKSATKQPKTPKRLYASVFTDGTIDDAESKRNALITYEGNVVATYELVAVSKPISAAKATSGSRSL